MRGRRVSAYRPAESLLADIRRVRRGLLDELRAQQEPGGWWRGELSSSALSTATSVVACELMRAAGGADDRSLRRLRDDGLDWLIESVNEDGGWGDTVRSRSNISTTMLVRAAMGVCGRDADCVTAADRWIAEAAAGHRSPAAAVKARYGRDRTFSVPILMMCALAGQVSWKAIPRLPFELARLPRRFYAAARLPVVSYALPALIAIGQLLHDRNPTRWPGLRQFRDRSVEPTLRTLSTLQTDGETSANRSPASARIMSL